MELYDEAERERYVAATKAAIDRLGAKWNGQTLAELLALADEPDEIAREMPFAVQQSVLLQALRFASVIQHSHDLAAELRQATRDRRILAAQQQYDCDAYGALLDQLGLVSEGEAGPPRADQVIPVFERFIGEGQAWLDELAPPVAGGPRPTPAQQREAIAARLRAAEELVHGYGMPAVKSRIAPDRLRNLAREPGDPADRIFDGGCLDVEAFHGPDDEQP